MAQILLSKLLLAFPIRQEDISSAEYLWHICHSSFDHTPDMALIAAQDLVEVPCRTQEHSALCTALIPEGGPHLLLLGPAACQRVCSSWAPADGLAF